jgi:copper chaperone
MQLRVTGMHCGSCGLLVDETLEELPGVRSASTDVRAGRTVVEVDPALCTAEQIVAAVAEAGYSAKVAG